MACVYVLFSVKTGKNYIGSSRDDQPAQRIRSHNAGWTRSTKHGRPWHLVFHEKYGNYRVARQRELFLKTGQGRKYINQIVEFKNNAERCESG